MELIILENAYIVDTNGTTYTIKANDPAQRVRIQARLPVGGTLGWFLPHIGDGEEPVAEFFKSRGKFQISGALTEPSTTAQNECLIMNVRDHGGRNFEISWW